tara:strand:- start:1915 stop:2313 length:399 start_codon:yes stop_codon:yes gene_type:complete
MKLPEDIINKIYKTRYDIGIGHVKKEFNETVPTYRGDFSKHPDEFMQSEGPYAYQVITDLDAWNIMKTSPPTGQGYMFWNNPEIVKIRSAIDERRPVHSGASMGFLMQHMHNIAVHGWDNYYNEFILKQYND